VEIRIDPTGKWQKATGTRFWSFELDTRNLALGKHTIYARAFDGTDSSPEQNIALMVDNPAPKSAEARSFIPGFEAGWLAMASAAALLVALRKRR
jgi:hypothetical protein